MKLIIKETLVIIAIILLGNVLLVEFMELDQQVLNEMTKILIISLIIQPWVIYQFTH